MKKRLPTPSAVFALLQEMTLALNEIESRDAALAFALEKIAQFLGWPWAHAYNWSDKTAVLTSTHIWYNDESAIAPTLRSALEQRAWAIDEVGPGKALDSNAPFAIAYIDQSPYAESGIQGYLALPVQTLGTKTAVLEFLSPENEVPDEEMLAVVSHMGALLSTTLQRIQTERNLRESERRFRAIFNQTFQFIGLMSPDGTLLEANETALQFGGLAADDVLGKPFWEAYWWTITPETQVQLKAAVARAAAGEFVRYEVEVWGHGDTIATIDFSIKPIKNKEGKVVLLLPEGRDISEQQEAIGRLQQSQMQLAEAQRIAHIGHWEWDVRTNKITWSDELYGIYGLQPNESLSSYEAFLAFVHPDDLLFAQQKMDEAYYNGRSFSYFQRIVRQDGNVRVLNVRGRPVQDSQGQVIRVYGTAQDMTEQRATELKLSRTVRQLSALNEMGQAIASSLDLPSIYEYVLRAIRPLLHAEAVILFLHEKNELVVAALDHSGIGDMTGLRVPDQAGVAGTVWQYGRSLHLQGEECVQQLSPSLTEPTGYRPQAMLAVPMRWQDQRIGVLEATHTQPDAFHSEDLELLEMAATWTAIAIGNARQYEQLQRRLRESEAIARIGQALAETLDLDQVLNLIVDLAQQLVPNVDWTAIHLLYGQPESLHLVASAGLDLGSDTYELAIGEGIAGRVINKGQVINVTDMEHDERRLPIHDVIDVRSLLVAPVLGHRRLGTISLQCSRPNAFTAEDEQLLTILGIQAGLTIDNARLLDSQRRARQLAERQRERMRRLSRQVITAQEEERQRISRELHDEAGQSLTSLKISLDLIRATLSDDLGFVKEGLAEISDLADQTMSNLRHLAHNLRPPGLDAFGLDAALAGLCQDFMNHTQLEVEYKDTDVPVLPPMIALTLYRFAQEALTNVAKHAEADHIEMKLQMDAEKIFLSVTDNGVGFRAPIDLESQTKAAGIGLAGMYERLETIGGTLEIHSKPKQGTTLVASVPLREE